MNHAVSPPLGDVRQLGRSLLRLVSRGRVLVEALAKGRQVRLAHADNLAVAQGGEFP